MGASIDEGERKRRELGPNLSRPLDRSDELHDLQARIRDARLDREDVGEVAAFAKRSGETVSVEALADFYHRVGRRQDAETQYLRSAKLWEELLGPDQPRIGITVHNLAVVYLEDCRVEEALPLIARVVGLWERTLGPDHPDRLAAIRSEANGLRSCGRLDEAAELEVLLDRPGE